ncbi:ROK family transcriptional regulator, partial [Desertihabitans aurantiacus]|uniref:ROK family transcriptional regulator n=1 Tax=Desertihabitans aurantiacus TaxID=2282477 RepID=UPI00130074CA
MQGKGTAQPPGRGTTRLRHLNTRRVLQSLRQLRRPASIAELAARTELTRPTVAQIVAALEAAGHLRRHEPLGGAGRPAARYAVDQRSFAVLGADAGASRTVVELATLDGTVLARRETRRTQSLDQRTLRAMADLVRACLVDSGLAPSAVVAGTVASPGIIEPSTGRITLRQHLGDWHADQIAEVIGAGIGGDVTVENDASLATLAMSVLPEVPATFLGLQWGQRLGAGVILDGQLLRGRTGAVGEIGSLLVSDPVDGRTAQLEEVVRASRLPELAGCPGITTEELVRQAGAGDAGAREALGRAVDPLAAAVAPLCLGLDVGVVTLSGAIAR